MTKTKNGYICRECGEEAEALDGAFVTVLYLNGKYKDFICGECATSHFPRQKKVFRSEFYIDRRVLDAKIHEME